MSPEDCRHYCDSFEEWLECLADTARSRRPAELLCADLGARNLRLLAATRRSRRGRELFVLNAGAWDTVEALYELLREIAAHVGASRRIRWVVDLPGAIEWDPARGDFFARLTSLPGQPALYRRRLQRVTNSPVRIVNDGFAIGAALIAMRQAGRLEGTFVGPPDAEPPGEPNEAIGYLCPGSGVATGLIIPEPTGPRRAMWVIRPMEIQHFAYPALPGDRRDHDWLRWVARQDEPPFRLEFPACGLGLPAVYEWTHRRHARALRRRQKTPQLEKLRRVRARVARSTDAAAAISQLAQARRPDPAAREAVQFHLLALARIAANLALQLPQGGIYLAGPNIVANRAPLLASGFWAEYLRSTDLQEDLLASIPVILLDSPDPFYVTYLQLAGALWLAEHRFDLLNLPPGRQVRAE